MDFQRHVASLYSSVFNLPFAEFQRHALETIRAVVDFDSAAWINGVGEPIDIHSIVLVNQPESVIRHYLDHFADMDLIRSHAVREPGRAFRIEDIVPLDMFRQHPAYTHFWSRNKVEHAMAVAVMDPITSLMEFFVLWRADRSRPFEEGNRFALQAFALHAATAWRHRQMVHVFEQVAARPDSPRLRRRSHAVCDSAGTIYAADPNFVRMVRSRWPRWEGPGLPLPLAQVLDSGARNARIEGLELQITREEVRYLVAISEPSPAEQLSRAELRVARRFAAGEAHAQIASSLNVSPSTVRNQIAAIYRKLDIHSKVELARLIEPEPSAQD